MSFGQVQLKYSIPPSVQNDQIAGLEYRNNFRALNLTEVL